MMEVARFAALNTGITGWQLAPSTTSVYALLCAVKVAAIGRSVVHKR